MCWHLILKLWLVSRAQPIQQHCFDSLRHRISQNQTWKIWSSEWARASHLRSLLCKNMTICFEHYSGRCWLSDLISSQTPCLSLNGLERHFAADEELQDGPEEKVRGWSGEELQRRQPPVGTGDDESSWRPQKLQRRMSWIEVLLLFEGCLISVEHVQKDKNNRYVGQKV